MRRVIEGSCYLYNMLTIQYENCTGHTHCVSLCYYINILMISSKRSILHNVFERRYIHSLLSSIGLLIIYVNTAVVCGLRMYIMRNSILLSIPLWPATNQT